MADSLKKGIGPKYLVPVITAYAGVATLLGASMTADLQSLLQRFGIAGISGLVVLVVQDLLPRGAKEVLIFWRWRDRLPGCRAFSHYAKQDARIDQSALTSLLPDGLMTPTEQNVLWYGWLKSLEKDPAISDNHHRVLALRDSSITIFFLVLISPLMILAPGQTWNSAGILTAMCAAVYLVTRFAAYNSAVRLVGNVIARKIAGLQRLPRGTQPRPRRRKP